jgi:hypothetical protein
VSNNPARGFFAVGKLVGWQHKRTWEQSRHRFIDRQVFVEEAIEKLAQWVF